MNYDKIGDLNELMGIKTLDDMVKDHILMVINKCNGKKRPAAKVLGITIKTLYNKLERWGLKEQYVRTPGEKKCQRYQIPSQVST